MQTTIATKIWVATALLHREQPNTRTFSKKQIIERVDSLPGTRPERQTLQVHLGQHVIANRPPSTSKLRYLYREPDNQLRLFREGDDYHPERSGGRITPKPDQVPESYQDLFDFYRDYAKRAPTAPAEPDPFLSLRGLGKEMWRSLGGAEFIRELRSEWYGASASGQKPRATKAASDLKPEVHR